MFGRNKSKGRQCKSARPYIMLKANLDASEHAEFALGNKTVSRQHLLVKVDPVEPADCVRLGLIFSTNLTLTPPRPAATSEVN